MSLDVYLTTDGCPTCGRGREVYWANITHNLGDMAKKAGIYTACWRPEEIPAEKASEIAPIIEEGLARMKAEPARFRAFDSPNGWGTYDDFIPWLERYLEALRQYPEATVRASR